MNDNMPGQSSSLDEIYTLIDKNRVDAARAAQTKFHSEMETAIAAIASTRAPAMEPMQMS